MKKTCFPILLSGRPIKDSASVQRGQCWESACTNTVPGIIWQQKNECWPVRAGAQDAICTCRYSQALHSTNTHESRAEEEINEEDWHAHIILVFYFVWYLLRQFVQERHAVLFSPGGFFFFLFLIWTHPDAPGHRGLSNFSPTLKPQTEGSRIPSAVVLEQNLRILDRGTEHTSEFLLFSDFNATLKNRVPVIWVLTPALRLLCWTFCVSKQHWSWMPSVVCAEKNSAVASDSLHSATPQRLEWLGACCHCTYNVCSACVRPSLSVQLWAPSLC